MLYFHYFNFLNKFYQGVVENNKNVLNRYQQYILIINALIIALLYYMERKTRPLSFRIFVTIFIIKYLRAFNIYITFKLNSFN